MAKTNCKMLFSEAQDIHRLISRQIKSGKLYLNKNAHIDVDKVPQSTLLAKDKVVEGIGYMVSLGIAGIGFAFGGTYVALVLFCISLVICRYVFIRYIMYPFYFVRWNSCMPFDMATAKPSRKFKIFRHKKKHMVRSDGTEYAHEAKEELGDLEFIEMKVVDNPGITIHTPENYKRMQENVTMGEYLKAGAKDKMPWAMIIIMLAMGFMLCAVMFPNGIQAAMQAASQGLAPAAGAAPATGQFPAP